MSEIKITIPLVPKPQARDRIGTINGKARSFKAKAQREAEADIRFYLDRERPRAPITGAVALTVRAYMPIPKSWPRWKREAAIDGQVLPTSRPDLDNLIKQIKDTMTASQYWRDDDQVVRVYAVKSYSTNPRWEIGIEAWPQPEKQRDLEEVAV
jgi:Holliday junction resolvase RusA-like endonuclease